MALTEQQRMEAHRRSFWKIPGHRAVNCPVCLEVGAQDVTYAMNTEQLEALRQRWTGAWKDQQVVAHSERDVPALIAEVDRLRAVLADIEGALPAASRLITDDAIDYGGVDLAESVRSLTQCWKHGEKSPAQCHICDNDD